MSFVKDKNIFSPSIGYPLFYVVYYFIGSINITLRGGAIPLDNVYFFVIGLISYFIGIFLYNSLNKNYKIKITHNYSIRNLRAYGYFFYFVGMLFLLLPILITKSIPAFEPEVRRDTSSYIIVLTNLSWIGLLLIVFSKMQKFKFKLNDYLLMLPILILYFLTGYRTPVLLIILIIMICIHYSYKKISRAKLVMGGGILFLVSTIIPTIRDNILYGKEHMIGVYTSQGIPENMIIFAPVYSVLREGPNIFNQLISSLNGNFLYGKAFLSNYITILPGDNLNIRYIIAEIINSPSWVTKTPSIIGFLYLDFGVLSIIIGMFILGVFMQHYYIKIKKNSQDGISLIIFAYFFTASLLGIHSGGFFEPIVVINLIILEVVKKLTTLKNKSKMV
nr:O-antigen polymerase [Bacillus sp. AFS053548]